MALKSDVVPVEQLAFRATHGDVVALQIQVSTYRDWKEKPLVVEGGVGQAYDPNYDAVIPPGMSVSILDQADEVDPNNRLRMFWLSIGDRLAYRVTLTDGSGSEREMLRLAMLALFVTAVDNAAEIRDAIAIARKEAVASAA